MAEIETSKVLPLTDETSRRLVLAHVRGLLGVRTAYVTSSWQSEAGWIVLVNVDIENGPNADHTYLVDKQTNEVKTS